MVINSTNICYQQNEQPPFILTELSEHKKDMTYDVRNPGSGLGQAQKCDGVKPVELMGPQRSSPYMYVNIVIVLYHKSTLIPMLCRNFDFLQLLFIFFNYKMLLFK